jgi:hypothetical protein
MTEELEQPPEDSGEEFEDVESIDESGDKDEAEQEEALAEALEDVDYEGKQYKLPKELKEALLRQADYTRKTQEVAEQRRQIEIEKQQAQMAIQATSAFQQEYAQLQNFDAQLEQLRNIDWNAVINEDPQTAMKLQVRFNDLLRSRNDTADRIGHIQQDLEQRRQAEITAQLQRAEIELKAAIPEWGSEELRSGLVKTAMSSGFEADDLANITDPRMIKVLHKAYLYDKAQQKLAKAAPSAQEIKPATTIKSGKGSGQINPDKLSADDWVKWREGTLKKQGVRV